MAKQLLKRKKGTECLGIFHNVPNFHTYWVNYVPRSLNGVDRAQM